jgi:hypothetical protein
VRYSPRGGALGRLLNPQWIAINANHLGVGGKGEREEL